MHSVGGGGRGVRVAVGSDGVLGEYPGGMGFGCMMALEGEAVGLGSMPVVVQSMWTAPAFAGGVVVLAATDLGDCWAM